MTRDNYTVAATYYNSDNDFCMMIVNNAKDLIYIFNTQNPKKSYTSNMYYVGLSDFIQELENACNSMVYMHYAYFEVLEHELLNFGDQYELKKDVIYTILRECALVADSSK